MIKKILSSLIVLAIFSTSILFADMVVPASALPKQAATFIKKIYPNAQIWKVERDGGKFDVELSNGASIDFLTNGDWVNIDGEYNGVPFSVLPQAVAHRRRMRDGGRGRRERKRACLRQGKPAAPHADRGRGRADELPCRLFDRAGGHAAQRPEWRIYHLHAGLC